MSSGCPVAEVRGAVSVEGTEGAIKGATEKASSQGGRDVSIFGERCRQSTSRGSSEENSDEQQRVGVDGERRVAWNDREDSQD
jgi:hypothetical protein